MDEKRKNALLSFCDKYSIPHASLELLDVALIHKSYANELPEYKDHALRENLHNQRLEFLGDAVLGLVICEYLYLQHPTESEGELTLRKTEAVCEPALYEIATQIELSTLLVQGRGERQDQKSISIFADAVEAVIAAIFLSCGFEAVRNFILPLWQPLLTQRVRLADSIDYKSWLQIYLAQTRHHRPEYRLVDSQGPDHQRTFFIQLSVNGKHESSGEGASRKRAEQQAAKAYIEKYKLDGPSS